MYVFDFVKLDQVFCVLFVYLLKEISGEEFYIVFKVFLFLLGFSDDSVIEVSLFCVEEMVNMGVIILFQENS